MRQKRIVCGRVIRVVGSLLVLCIAMLAASGCAPIGGTSPTPTASPEPTVKPTEPMTQEVEGLVIIDNGQVIIGVDWLSESRVTYCVMGGDLEGLRALDGETVVVQGEVMDRSQWLKEIAVADVRVSVKPGRLSRRIGFIKELGISIYMQGTHVLTDREGKTICLLSSAEGGPDLDNYMRDRVAVLGVLENAVEGNAKIMKVQRVEKVK